MGKVRLKVKVLWNSTEDGVEKIVWALKPEPFIVYKIKKIDYENFCIYIKSKDYTKEQMLGIVPNILWNTEYVKSNFALIGIK